MNINEIEQRYKDEYGRMYGSAYEWMIEEIKQWQQKFHERCDTQLDEFRKCGMTDAVIHCVDIINNEAKNVVLDRDTVYHLLTAIRKEFPTPKAG